MSEGDGTTKASFRRQMGEGKEHVGLRDAVQVAPSTFELLDGYEFGTDVNHAFEAPCEGPGHGRRSGA